VADDFAWRNQHKTLSMLTLHRLAKGGIIWSWNEDAKEDLFILSNAVGIYFSQPMEAPTSISTILNEAPSTLIGNQPIHIHGTTYIPSSLSNQQGTK
jgi:hypothetical protein